jgi:hypothetical protein
MPAEPDDAVGVVRGGLVAGACRGQVAVEPRAARAFEVGAVERGSQERDGLGRFGRFGGGEGFGDAGIPACIAPLLCAGCQEQ